MSLNWARSQPPTAVLTRPQAIRTGRRTELRSIQLRMAGSRALSMYPERMAVPSPRALSGTRLRTLPARLREYPSPRSIRAVPSENRLSTFSRSMGRMALGVRSAREARSSWAVMAPERRVLSRAGIAARSSRTAKAHNRSTSMAKNTKVMLTPMPTAAPRGIRRFFERKETTGSAARARTSPPRKGARMGSSHRAARKTAAAAATVSAIRLAFRECSSFRRFLQE